MILHNDITQGSEAWHKLRNSHLTASDAAAMMGDSKYKSRKQLLHEKKTGRKEEVSPAKQALFDRGHETESAAREIIEMEMLEEFLPAVCSVELDGLPLLSSLDGLSCDGDIIFEHKLWNETLAENVRNEVLEPEHYWQLEHQLLVVDATKVLFVVSDGTTDKMEYFYYQHDPDRRSKLISGWKQFDKDLKVYVPEAKVEPVVGNDSEAFPMVTYEIQGSAIVSNIADVLPIIKDRAEQEMNRVLETDQDFADKEKLNKETKAARAKLKEVVAAAQGEFVSFKEFSETAAKIDSVLQKMQAHGEKQVKQAKAAKKQAIIDAANAELAAFTEECSKRIAPLDITRIIGNLSPDWESAMKGKRNIDSLQNAVDALLAKTKINIDQVMSRVVPNQIFLKEHAAEYAFLFADTQQIIDQDMEVFQSIVKLRIAEHKQAEQEKAEALREKIRREEERRAEEKQKREQEESDRARTEAAEETLRKEASEPVDTQCKDPGKIVTIEPTEKKPTASPSKINENRSFAEDMADWASKYSIPIEATVELKQIFERHGIEFRKAS